MSARCFFRQRGRGSIHKSGGHSQRLVIGHTPLLGRQNLPAPAPRSPAARCSTPPTQHSRTSHQFSSASLLRPLNITREPAAWPARPASSSSSEHHPDLQTLPLFGFILVPDPCGHKIRIAGLLHASTLCCLGLTLAFTVDRPLRVIPLWTLRPNLLPSIIRSAPAAFPSYWLPRLGLDTCRITSSRP